MSKIRALARYLAEQDGVDPDAKAIRNREPLRTSVGLLQVFAKFEDNLPLAETFYTEKATAIVKFLEGIPS